jgi:hypothetical protein
MKLTELLGKKLEGFSVEQFTEVFMVDCDGRKSKSLGFFHNETIANAFAGNQKDANWHKVRNVLVLTDGINGFIVGEPIEILNDEQTTLEIREKAKAKLSDAERKILGID